ncbi:MAG: HAMP domain-containing histidine kinase [Lachnospiraceae bacterium]|nr:HAMP domain-containing histidine kinase [Lachnospiraceae bacterium]
MKFFRNPEVKQGVWIHIIIMVVASTTSFLWKKEFGMFMLGWCMLFLVTHIFTTYRRYKKISELATDIDCILHGKNAISIEKYAEGELGILQSEIYKMTVRLREQQQKLTEDKIYLADSIADISHQIRTPLTSMNLIISFLSEPGIAEERKQKLIQELYQLLSRIEWLITTLLKISKLDAGTVTFRKEKIHLEELIKKSVSPLAIPMELREQKLVVNANGIFLGDVGWTCEAIGNIVKNCMEHTPEGGKITISATENAIFTEIVIHDTGKGIAKEDIPHIFERFYKGKDTDKNSFGIGLALARMIVTMQQGTIKAQNKVEGGAEFIIRFYKNLNEV